MRQRRRTEARHATGRKGSIGIQEYLEVLAAVVRAHCRGLLEVVWFRSHEEGQGLHVHVRLGNPGYRGTVHGPHTVPWALLLSWLLPRALDRGFPTGGIGVPGGGGVGAGSGTSVATEDGAGV